MSPRPRICAGACSDDRCCWCGKTRDVGDISDDGVIFHQVCWYCVPRAVHSGKVRATRLLLFGIKVEQDDSARTYVQRFPTMQTTKG